MLGALEHDVFAGGARREHAIRLRVDDPELERQVLVVAERLVAQKLRRRQKPDVVYGARRERADAVELVVSGREFRELDVEFVGVRVDGAPELHRGLV